MSKLALFFGAVLFFACQLTNSSLAQNKTALPDANPPYPPEAQITFQWNYTCQHNSGACSFRCPGVGEARAVRTLDIYLGTIPTGKDQRSPALFYNFSTDFIPRSNGFSITAGISVLSCQVNGMNLDYSGPPKDRNLTQ
jgi:hypothetical protein